MADEILYKENILDHYAHPRNKRAIEGYNLKGEGVNANCGDALSLFLKFEGDTVTDASFMGEGCAVSQAGASMLTERLKGLSRDEMKLLTPGDLYGMLGIRVSPARTACALLSYAALQNAFIKRPE